MQRHERAERGERKAGENRDRMDEALVQHAENDVDDEHGEPSSSASPCCVPMNACASPEKLATTVAGSTGLRIVLHRSSPRSPSETPGARLNEIVTDGSCPA